MKRLAILFALLLAAPLAAQQIRVDVDKSCAVALGDLVPQVDRACIRIELAKTVVQELRDALTASMPSAGGGNVVMPCTECSVRKSYAGCAAEGATVIVPRQSAWQHVLACTLSSHVVQKREREEHATAETRINRNVDLGNGTP